MLPGIVSRMGGLDAGLRRVLHRLEFEAAAWQERPIRRVQARNRLVRPWRGHRFHSFGRASIVDRPLWVYGPQQIAIGAEVIVLRGCWLAVESMAWGRPAPVLDIGDRVAMRPGCTISAADSIVIEDDVGMGAYVTVIDSRHTWKAGHPNPMHNPIESAPVRVGRGSWLADRATVAAGADIGEQCAIGPNTVVSGTVPDFSIVLGNPGRVVGSTRA